MKPIEFTCTETVPRAAPDVTAEIVDVERWPEFPGYGIVPGIASARFEHRTEAVAGSRIRVSNRDGSTHTEEIIAWQPGERVTIRMSSFSRPLNLLADHFIEDWRLSPGPPGATIVSRTFSLHERNLVGRGVLALVAIFLRKAVTRHLLHMRRDAEAAIATRGR